MKISRSLIFTFVIGLSATSSYVLLKNDANEGSLDSKTAFSTVAEAKKTGISSGVLRPSVLFASQVNTKENSKKTDQELKSPLLLASYKKNFKKAPAEIGNSLELLEKEHEVLLQNMRKEGVKIDPITILKPRLAIALTYFLNLNLGELGPTDLTSVKLTNEEWYLIKTFSESKDFAIMLKRESLSSEFVQIKNLTRYYRNNS